MILVTGLHHRVTDENGNAYLYMAESAAIHAVDPLADRIATTFARPREAAVGLAELSDPEAEGALRELVDLGVIRPFGEGAVPRAKLPPMPSLFSPSNFSVPDNGFCSARGGATVFSAGGTSTGGATGGEISVGCESRPFTIWLDSKSFFPSMAGRSLLPSGVATG